ncbi:hypothetical protein ABT147_23965 [Streptomyces sp. NPDC001868]|uniref:hypothetical protein n=1 Tax=Streptomyces sp. NPDC001868 TaxID=3154401 RepID=UPI0033167D71
MRPGRESVLNDRRRPLTPQGSPKAVVRGVTAAQVWRYLTDTSTWESYYDNVADISYPNGDAPELKADVAFGFGTFGFPPLDARVVEFQAPARRPRPAPAQERPNPRLNGHQAWLDGLVGAAAK